ncbi:MAG TPA: hypothetical protein VNQ76_09710 [Planctomicrobium sp.]|nr:hypothetical protein [Planctomicrobium sp.]
MTTELKRHSGHRLLFDLHINTPSKTLPLVCPTCQNPISMAAGLCGHRLVQAIMLQSERIGTELECHNCGLRFVFQRSTRDVPMKTVLNMRAAPEPETCPDFS